MKLRYTQILPVKGKRRQQYVVVLKFRDFKGESMIVQLSRKDIAKIVVAALQ